MKLILSALLATAALLPARDGPPNLVFILADDLGWADTTLYGHTRLYRTPNLERLAKRGMTFTRAYSASPLCSPTRASILTGLSPARTGITSPNCHLPQVSLQATPGTKGPPHTKTIAPSPVTRLDPKHRTIAEALKEAGYATGHFGKWHLGKEPYSPLAHGFDVDVPHWPGPGPAGSYVAPWKFPDFDPDTPDEHLEDRMAREAAQFIAAHRDGPFFLNYWMFSVHAPFDAKKDLIDDYRARIDPSDPQRSPTYAAMVESMDDAVGSLLDTLDRHGLTERTIVIFFSDNGGNMYNTIDGTTPTSNAPLRGGKATMFEGGIRVPMMVSWPGRVAPGSRSDCRVQSDDFHPTILAMLGLEPADDQRFDGQSFLPALLGAPYQRSPSFTYFPHAPPVPDWIPPSVAVHDGDWKLIRIFHGGEDGAHRWKLFNLAADLGERENLAAREPDRVERMDALIETFLDGTGAVRPVRNPAFDPSRYRPEDEGKGRIRNKPAPKPPARQARRDAEFPGLQGWKARHTEYAVKNGVVHLRSAQPAPFLGIAPGGAGPAEVTLRVRAERAGEGRVEWIPADRKPRSVPFHVNGGDWNELTISLPAEGPLGILRLYLPARGQTVELDWVELRCAGDRNRRWGF